MMQFVICKTVTDYSALTYEQIDRYLNIVAAASRSKAENTQMKNP
jgi:hypothetical protein